jgi:glucose/arabinose dehydrogenase
MSRILVSLSALFLGACANAEAPRPFAVEEIAEFDEPWAMAFLPDGRLLVTEKAGRLLIVDGSGARSQPVKGIPDVDYGGQGGLGDIALHPDFAANGLVYLSYAEAGDGDTRGAAVVRGKLELNDGGGSLSRTDVIWRQEPKVTGRGHYGHRLLFDDTGHLFISSGERQKFDPAQDMSGNLGKIVRLHDDGSVPRDNPFYDDGGVAAQIWSLGHRNPLGIAFDLEGQLWNIEMGPKGGDELNFIVRGGNYGYPIVSNGDHYDDREIPDHDTRPEFLAPAAWWTPVISPGDLMVYSGELFADWRGNLIAAGLSSAALVRIEIAGEDAREVERYPMGARIRSVAQGPDGALWVLEDERNTSEGRLLKLTPRK